MKQTHADRIARREKKEERERVREKEREGANKLVRRANGQVVQASIIGRERERERERERAKRNAN